MAQNNIGVPGLGLPYPQFLTPGVLVGGNNLPPQSFITLAAGQAIPIPSGTWIVTTGRYTFPQELDPVSGIWIPLRTLPGVPFQIKSDGQNYRIANLTGCPINAIVSGAGSGYPTVGTTVTASGTGGSTWTAVIGGLVTSVTVTAAGAGYGIPPLVYISAPPVGGIQATAIATLSSGTVSAITVINQGGGYTTAPTVSIVQAPYDPSTSNITTATASIAAGGFVAQSTGSLAAVLCTNPGAPVASAPTLAVSGTGGSGATVTAQLLTTYASLSITAVGAGYPTNAAGAAALTYGGFPATTPANTNPNWEVGFVDPRPAQITLASTGTLTSVTRVVDGGLYLGTVPQVYVVSSAVPTTIGTATITTGSTSDTVILQQG